MQKMFPKRLLRKLPQLVGPLGGSVIRIEGIARTSEQRLSVVYGGNGSNRAFLERLLFSECVGSPIATASTPAGVLRQLRRHATDADLILAEWPPIWAMTAPQSGGIRVPAWIRQEIHLPAEATSWLLSRSLEREAARHARRHRYEVNFSTDDHDMLAFFHHFYKPYVQLRFGGEATVASERAFMDSAAGSRLAKLTMDGRWVAGLQVHQRNGHVQLGRFGLLVDLALPGASEVLDVAVIRDAYSRGVRRVTMGDSRPSLADGVARYKARFGARMTRTPFPQATLEFSSLRWTPALAATVNECLLVGFDRGAPRLQRIESTNDGLVVRGVELTAASSPSNT